MNLKEENQKLLEHCIEYAKELLEETGEAYPFGGYIDTIGNVHPLEMEVDNKNMPTISQVMDTLKKYCEVEMTGKRMCGYALTYEVSIEVPDEKKKDCIAIDITHESEVLPVFYLPFEKEASGEMKIGDLFAVKR
ncbi:MAG: hypothetical protein WDZ35_07225 [Crocinitomicaceae bacterium]